MESSKKRSISDGREFDHLFPPPSEQDKTIRGSASVEDTMALIRKTVPITLWHTEKIAKKLKGGTLEETCWNIWHFVYGHIQYKRDKDGVEQVRSPRRTWWERETGVDCDCYTEFISSILLNLNIPHKARITKYPKRFPEIPRWQHVYPIVPRPNKWHKALTNRDDYIVMDCVKDDFDDEQPFLECKDYDMRLDYLDGIEEEETTDEEVQLMDSGYFEPDSVDLADLASIYDDEELGNIFKKIGSAVKTAAQKVGTAAKTVVQNIKATAPIVAKKVADDVGKGIRVINRYVNPATILLRNGFLLAMKINLFNVAGRLRYAYLTDVQAKERGINLANLGKLRSVKDRAETVYWQAGGKKENLKKAILSGKGNNDKKVPLSGLFGLDNVYADLEEYNIIHSNPHDLEGLGEIASGAAITAATGAVAAIAAALKQIKGLFDKGGKDEQAFQSETDNAGTASSAPSMIPDDEDAMLVDQPQSTQTPSVKPQTSIVDKATNVFQIAKSVVTQVAPQKTKTSVTPSIPVKTVIPPKTYGTPPPALPPMAPTPPPQTVIPKTTTSTPTRSNEISTQTASAKPVAPPKSVLPASNSVTRRSTTDVEQAPQNTAVQTSENEQEAKGFVQKTTTWIKANPGKSLLIAGAVAGGGLLLVKAFKNDKGKGQSLSALPSHKKHQRIRKKSQKNKKHKAKGQKYKVQKLNLL